LPTHPTLGTLYVVPADFKARLKVYGCQKAYDALGADAGDALIEEFIAAASRQIDAYAQQLGFSPDDQFSENHPFDLRTRRVSVNNPPVFDLLSFAIRTGPGAVTNFTLTPTSNGPDGTVVSWGPIHYNRQENYLELSALSVVGNQIATLITLGLMEPQAEFKYKQAPLKPAVAAATAWQTALLLNESYRESQVGAGVRSMSTPELSVSFEKSYTTGVGSSGDEAPLHPMAKQLLKPLKRIAIA